MYSFLEAGEKEGGKNGEKEKKGKENKLEDMPVITE